MLIAIYSSESLYTFPSWVDKSEKDNLYINSLKNPRAHRWIKKNWSRINDKHKLFKNPHPSVVELLSTLILDENLIKSLVEYLGPHTYSIFNKHLDVISKSFPINDLLKNIIKCPNIELIKQIIERANIDFDLATLLDNNHDEPLLYGLSNFQLDTPAQREIFYHNIKLNPNPIAINYMMNIFLKSYPEYKLQYIKNLMGKSSDLALDIIESNLDILDDMGWALLNSNPNPRAHKLVIDNSKIMFPFIAENPSAIPLIKKEIARIKSSEHPNQTRLYNIFVLLLGHNTKCLGIVDEYLGDIFGLGIIHLLTDSDDPELIKWIGLHQDLISYSQDIEKINMNDVAKINSELLADRYGNRYPKKLIRYMYN